jgi:hypothetical protein
MNAFDDGTTICALSSLMYLDVMMPFLLNVISPKMDSWLGVKAETFWQAGKTPFICEKWKRGNVSDVQGKPLGTSIGRER